MKGLKIASRYAKALIDIAKEQNSLDRISEDMRLIYDSCKANHELLVFLRSPVINNDKKQAILKEIFASSVSEVTMKFLDIITSKNREMLIPLIADSFISQYKLLRNIHTAEIVTAVPMDETLRSEVLNLVKKYTHTEVELREKVNPEILGGYVLTMEDKQDDTSLRTKLNKLKRSFNEYHLS